MTAGLRLYGAPQLSLCALCRAAREGARRAQSDDRDLQDKATALNEKLSLLPERSRKAKDDDDDF